MSNGTVSADDDLDVWRTWEALRAHKLVIALFVIAGGGVAAAIALTTTPVFRAEVVVTQVQDTGMSGMASLANQFSGIASLAGINLPMGAGNGQEAQAVLASRRLVEEFVVRNNLAKEMSVRSSKELSLWRAVKSFQDEVLFIREDKRNGVTTVAVEWTDPEIAANWANAIVKLANELMRQHAYEQANRNIKYLNSQIAQTNIVELQKVMYNLVENETKTLMLANAREEYSFRVVDPAVPPELRARPKRTIMVLIGGVVGLLIGAAFAVARRAISRRVRSEENRSVAA